VTIPTANPIHQIKADTFMATTPDILLHQINPVDKIGIIQLVNNGTVVVLLQGTSVLLLDTKSDYHEVRVTSGQYNGQHGYVETFGVK
jgi:hypothetical protein